MNQIPKLESYKDLLKKAEYDYKRFSTNSNDPYTLLDCLLTLNAIPEWIIHSQDAPEGLKLLAKEKNYNVMKNWKFSLNEDMLENDINHQLNFLRRICNQNKHNKDKSIPSIDLVYGGTLTATFPVKLYHYVSIGEKNIDVQIILKGILDFWREKIN